MSIIPSKIISETNIINSLYKEYKNALLKICFCLYKFVMVVCVSVVRIFPVLGQWKTAGLQCCVQKMWNFANCTYILCLLNVYLKRVAVLFTCASVNCVYYVYDCVSVKKSNILSIGSGSFFICYTKGVRGVVIVTFRNILWLVKYCEHVCVCGCSSFRCNDKLFRARTVPKLKFLPEYRTNIEQKRM